MQQFRGNCDSCQLDYEFDKERDIAYLCLTDSRANHVIAKCPHCENVTQIFAEPELFMAILAELHLPLRMSGEPSDELMGMMVKLGLTEDLSRVDEAAEVDNSVYGEVKNHADPYAGLPWPARDDLIELWDSMRHFGGECGAKCLWHVWP